MKKLTLSLTLAGLALGLSTLAASAQTIYSDTFDRNGDLGGTSPEYPGSSGGVTWYSPTPGASGGFTTTTADGGSADTTDQGVGLLPLNVTAGNIYNVSANIAVAADSGSWMGIGFAAGENDPNTFIGSNVAPWTLVNPGGSSQFWAGPNGSNSISTLAAGSSDLFTVTLNTTQPDWVASYYVGNTLEATYTYTGTGGSNPNPDIQFVGFGGFYNSNTVASISNFLVTEGAVPEPSTWAMVLCGVSALAFIQLRRRFPSLR